jgi:hypothetical protein
MPINSVAGTQQDSGGLARAGRMWWTPEQGGLRPEFRQTEEVQSNDETEAASPLSTTGH